MNAKIAGSQLFNQTPCSYGLPLLEWTAKIAGKASNFSRQNTMQIWAFITTMDCKNQFQQTQNTDGLSLLEWTDKIAGSMSQQFYDTMQQWDFITGMDCYSFYYYVSPQLNGVLSTKKL